MLISVREISDHFLGVVPENIGDQIFEYRQMRGMDRRELALEVGVRTQIISNWEKGIVPARISSASGIYHMMILLDRAIPLHERPTEYRLEKLEAEITRLRSRIRELEDAK